MNNENNVETIIDLGVFLRSMRKGLYKWFFVLLLVCILFGAGMVLYNKTNYVPMYQAQSSFAVSMLSETDEGDEEYGFNYNSRTANQLTQLFPYILESDMLQDLMKNSLGTNEINGVMLVKSVKNSNLFTLVVSSTSAKDAEEILNVALKYIPEVAQYVIGDTKLSILKNARVFSTPYNLPNYRRLLLQGIAIGLLFDVLFFSSLCYFPTNNPNTGRYKKATGY
ncbi:hypothetical protein P261_01246 [Lachnospiraceae bacterium TWA4]|nr:hypothetical protein P261_01246 [Lachnospiraceae bacterium TWA4]